MRLFDATIASPLEAVTAFSDGCADDEMLRALVRQTQAMKVTARMRILERKTPPVRPAATTSENGWSIDRRRHILAE